MEPLLSARSPIAQSLKLLALPLASPPTPLKLVQTALAVANLVLALVTYVVIHFTTSVTLFVAAQPAAAAGAAAAAFGVVMVRPSLTTVHLQRSHLVPKLAVKVMALASAGSSSVAGAAKVGAAAAEQAWRRLRSRSGGAAARRAMIDVRTPTAVATVAAPPAAPPTAPPTPPPAAPPTDVTAAAAAAAAAGVAARTNEGFRPCISFVRAMELLLEEEAAAKVPPRPPTPASSAAGGLGSAGAADEALTGEDTALASAARIKAFFEVEMRRDGSGRGAERVGRVAAEAEAQMAVAVVEAAVAERISPAR